MNFWFESELKERTAESLPPGSQRYMGGDLAESGRWDRPPPFSPEEDDGVN